MVNSAGGFLPFGPDHVTVLGLTGVAVVWLVLSRARLLAADDRFARRLLAALLVGNEVSSWIVGIVQGHFVLPLQLCDLAVLLTAAALWRPQRFVGTLAYFWGLAGSLQALLTPDLRQGFPDYWWGTFFVSHCGVVLSVVYLALTGRVRPTQRSLWWIWGLTNVYAAAVGVINWQWGTNYGYLARKPMHPSLLDSFGPWPFYILVMEVAAIASFYLYYAPFAVARWVAARSTRGA